MKRFYLPLIFIFLSALQVFATGPWTQRASMGGLGRHRAFSMAIGNHGYVGGGWNGMVMYMDMWEYDPATNSWTQKANLPVSMWSDPAFGIGTKGYVVNGANTYKYTPTTNSWAIVSGNSPWSFDQVKFVINGKGYSADNGLIYEFDPSTNFWTARLSASFFGDLAFAANGKGYFVDAWGGWMIEYDPVSNTAVNKSACPGQLSQAVSFGVNGKGYVGTGQIPPFNDDVNIFYEYDPATDTWRGINPFDGSGRENATAFTIGSKGYVGFGTSGINLNDLWEFDNAYVTGVNDIPENISFNVYPNPSVDGKIFFSFNGNTQPEHATITDLNGRVVLESQVTGMNSIDLSNLSNANYFISFSGAGNKMLGTKKIVLDK